MSVPLQVNVCQVYDYEIAPNGSPINGAAIEVTLLYDKARYVTVSAALEPQTVSTTTDANGYWQVSLVRNSDMTPSGVTYVVKTPTRRYAISVPAGAGPFQAGAIVSTPPAVLAQSVLPSTLNFLIDGSGNLPGTGIKGAVEVDFNATILSAALYADAVGSAVVDIFKSTYAGYPGSGSICAAALPTLAAAQKEKDSTLSGWTTSISAGDVLRFNLVSVASLTQLTLALALRKTV